MCCPKLEFNIVESVELLLELFPYAFLTHVMNISKLGNSIWWLLPGYAMFYNILGRQTSCACVCGCLL
jgi:hypothetical protein